jgi:hypothetical protein
MNSGADDTFARLLREMVDDLPDLRANLAALAVQPSTTALSLAAKKQAMQDTRNFMTRCEKNSRSFA